MVSSRCIMVVKSTLEELEIPYDSLELGEVEISENISAENLKLLDNKLRKWELELKENENSLIVEKIKSAIIELANISDDDMKVTLSDYLSQKLHYNSKFLSRLFSESEGMSMEKFYISNKIKHVKELLINDNLNLKEISYITRFSSPAHLSTQFKKNTGLAPSQYRQLFDRDSFSLGQAI